MKTYKFAVSLCGGWCEGFVEVKAKDIDTAYDMAMDCVADKLTEAFPTLGIDYNVECENPDYDEYKDEAEDNYFEAVEVCPHCDSENTYPMWDTEVNGFVAVCKHCGKEIFLCDACTHSDDNPNMYCNWCLTECGGKCFRGCTKD